MIHDAIVVGSGPGGAIAAATLASCGKSVLLVDRQPFPRDKVCGDGLPGNVAQLLETQFGLDIHTVELNHQRIFGISMGAPSGRAMLIPERPTRWYSMVSPRYHFDHVLHEFALRQGAHFEVMHIEGPLYADPTQHPTQQQVVGVIERKGTQHIEHEARVVIAADGAASAIATSVRGRVSDPVETALAIRAYARLKRPLPAEPVVYFRYLMRLIPGYAWIFPTARDRVNVGLGLFDQAVYKQQGRSLKELLSAFMEEMVDQFPMELEPGTLKSWPIPVWMSDESRVVKGAYLVGDAGRFVDALTGGGIFPAMITGQQAALAALAQMQGKPQTEAAYQYDTAWRATIGKSLRKLLWVQRWVGSKPPVFNTIFSVGEALPPLRNRLLTRLAGQHA